MSHPTCSLVRTCKMGVQVINMIGEAVVNYRLSITSKIPRIGSQPAVTRGESHKLSWHGNDWLELTSETITPASIHQSIPRLSLLGGRCQSTSANHSHTALPPYQIILITEPCPT